MVHCICLQIEVCSGRQSSYYVPRQRLKFKFSVRKHSLQIDVVGNWSVCSLSLEALAEVTEGGKASDISGVRTMEVTMSILQILISSPAFEKCSDHRQNEFCLEQMKSKMVYFPRPKVREGKQSVEDKQVSFQ